MLNKRIKIVLYYFTIFPINYYNSIFKVMRYEIYNLFYINFFDFMRAG